MAPQATQTRPLLAWSAAHLAQFRAAAETAVRCWADDWGAGGNAPGRALRGESADGDPRWATLSWQGLGRGGDAGGWDGPIWWTGDRLRAEVALALFEGDTTHDGIATRASAVACTDLLDRLVAGWVDLAAESAASTIHARSTPPPELFLPWSGAVVLACAPDFWLLVGPAVVEAFLRRRGLRPSNRTSSTAALPSRPPAGRPVVPLLEAAAPLAVAVRVEFEPVTLSVGELMALRPGDVIALPHRIDQPLLGKSEAGDRVCEAFLGRSGDRRAIELLRAAEG
ncbi:FliM/FliN family flagellar motor C-terminal domain-containing protein [Ramlibacter sp.]|uniref:FliM/FliN family flagellar motor switch protein n=1 Tax=Ramlibacter sp. TaxID=1917967 RepID=UPI003D0AAA12